MSLPYNDCKSQKSKVNIHQKRDHEKSSVNVIKVSFDLYIATIVFHEFF